MKALTQILEGARTNRKLDVSVAWIEEWWRPHTSTTYTSVAPGLRVRDLVPTGIPTESVSGTVNGQGIEDFDRELVAGDLVLLVNVLADAYLLANLLALVLTAASTAALAYLASKLLAQSEEARDPNNSASVYGFAGIRTNYNANGMPVPLHYGGDLRFGGLVIGESVLVIDGDPPQSFLKLIILLGAGPLAEIGGYTADVDGLTGSALPTRMKINGNSAVNFEDVEVHLRFGTPGQKIGPGFDELETFYGVNLVIDNATEPDPPTTD